MRSALIISPSKNGESYEAALKRLLSFVHTLSSVLGKRCELLLQHSLSEQKMAIMVTVGGKHYGDYGETFEKAVDKTIKDIRQKIPAVRGIACEISKPDNEPKTRSKGSTRSRRKSASRKRSYGSRKR